MIDEQNKICIGMREKIFYFYFVFVPHPRYYEIMSYMYFFYQKFKRICLTKVGRKVYN